MAALHSQTPRILVALVLLLLSMPDSSVVAQTDGGNWSLPYKLFEEKGTVSEPSMATDRTGMLHAVWAYAEQDSPMTIFYARWDGTVWSQPIDIVAMSGTLYAPRIAIDHYGRVHLIWHGPGNTLFYSGADAIGASAAANWSKPQSLAQSNPHTDIAIDEEGVLHVVYPMLQEEGVGYITSSDGGQTWTVPVHVATPANADATTDFARLSIASGGLLHVVWTELAPSGWPSLGVYYARSTDQGQTWSDPHEFAEDNYLEAGIVSADGNRVYVSWNALAGVRGRYYSWSSDGGVTWSRVGVVADPELGGGSTNPPELEVDSAGTVHMILNTSPGGDDATMYVSGRDGGWSPPLDISQRAPGYVGRINEQSALAITRGNTLNVLFVDNNSTRLWHTWKPSSAPAVAAVDFLSDNTRVTDASRPESGGLSPSPTVTVSTIEIRGGTAPGVARDADMSPPMILSTEMTLIVSIMPAFILVAGTMLLMLRRRRSR